MSRPPPPESEMPFEDALARLEELVRGLEGGELTLEESLRTFEEGVRLVRLCSSRLHAAELRIRELEEAADGPRERPVGIEEE